MNLYEQIVNLIRESQTLNEGEARIKRLGKAINKAVKKGDKTKESNLRSAAKSAEEKLNRRDDAGMAKGVLMIIPPHIPIEMKEEQIFGRKTWIRNGKTIQS